MNSYTDHFKRFRAGGAMAGMLAVAPALALEAAPAPQSKALAPIEVRERDESGFDALTGSDKRYTAPLLDTPKAVSVITSELLQSTGAVSLVEALRTVPGITFGAGEGGNPMGDRPFLRGFDSQGSMTVDGMQDIGASTREIFNIERIDVIKGSDGTFAGKGAAGGSINLTSKMPHAGNAAGVTVGIGTHFYKRATVDGNFQLSDTTAVRLNMMAHGQDIAGRQGVDAARWGFAPSVIFGLGTPTRFTASYYHLRTNDTPDSGIPYLYSVKNVPAGVDTITPAPVDRRAFYGLTNRDFRRQASDVATVGIEHDISSQLTVRSTLRAQRTGQDYVVTSPDSSNGNVVNGQVWRKALGRNDTVKSVVSQTELSGKVSTGGLQHRFTLGAELSQVTTNSDGYDISSGTGAICRTRGVGLPSGYNCTTLSMPNPGDPWRGTVRQRQDPLQTRIATKALYAFDTIEITPQWQVNLGLRVDQYGSNVLTSRKGGATRHSRSDTLINYQLGLIYKPVTNASLYLSYATSSSPAGALAAQGQETQALTRLNGDQMAPERNRSIELGSKWKVLEQGLTLNAALFQIDTLNARVMLDDTTFAMVGTKQVRGLELGFSGKPAPRWNVFGGYSYLNSRIGGNGVAVSDQGKVFPNVPRHSFTVWSTFDIEPRFKIGGGAFLAGKVFADPSNRYTVPGYVRIDAMARYQVNKHLDVQLNVQNVLNKTYFDAGRPRHYATIAPGRSAFITLRAQY